METLVNPGTIELQQNALLNVVDVLRELDAHRMCLRLLLWMMARTQPGGLVDMTQVEAARAFGVARSSVSEPLGILVAMNVVIRQGEYKSLSYWLHPDLCTRGGWVEDELLQAGPIRSAQQTRQALAQKAEESRLMKAMKEELKKL